MSIRHARKSDYKSVKDLLTKEEMIYPRQYTLQRFSKAITVNNKYSFVEERDGKVVGFITGFDDGGAFFGYMGRLVVDPKYRGRGIAKGLIKKSLSEFKSQGVQTVFVGIHKTNKASKSLVKKLNAKDGGYKMMYFKVRY